MASLIPGYNYDIFISYRQKDNKYDGWVTEFVENLKKELEATFKESINLYFDINPHDGLLESHEVEDSLKDKLKSVIFIPIISRTYCDPNSFAWQHEFLRFVEIASNDSHGLKVKLQGGNVASRILPIKINDIDKSDIKLCETILGGTVRGIDFIYSSPGVNRPLRANEDHANENLNKTYYRDQINKVAHSIHNLILGIYGKREIGNAQIQEIKVVPQKNHLGESKHITSPRKMFLGTLTLAILITLTIIILPILASNSREILEKAILVVDPYGNWPSFQGTVRLQNFEIDARSESYSVIELNRADDSYKLTTFKNGRKEVSGVQNGKYFDEILNSNIISPVSVINQDNIDYIKEHHSCFFGLLIELKNSGLQLKQKARRVNFQGIKCYAIDFSYDSSIKVNRYFKRNWTVFLNRKDLSLKGYQTSTEVGDLSSVKFYAIFSGTIKLNNIIIPLCVTYYTNSDDSFKMLDLITRQEE